MEILPDQDGYIDKECPNEDCLSQFKVNDEDWGNLFSDEAVYCPFCGHSAPADKWWTTEQVEQAKRQAVRSVEAKIGNALSRDAREFNRSQPRNSFIKMSMKYKGPTHFVNVPAEALAEMEQKIQCDNCGARYAVIGSAFFCPCCGKNSARLTFTNTIEKVRAKVRNIDAIRELISQTSKDEAARTCTSLLESCVPDLAVPGIRNIRRTGDLIRALPDLRPGSISAPVSFIIPGVGFFTVTVKPKSRTGISGSTIPPFVLTSVLPIVPAVMPGFRSVFPFLPRILPAGGYSLFPHRALKTEGIPELGKPALKLTGPRKGILRNRKSPGIIGAGRYFRSMTLAGKLPFPVLRQVLKTLQAPVFIQTESSGFEPEPKQHVSFPVSGNRYPLPEPDMEGLSRTDPFSEQGPDIPARIFMTAFRELAGTGSFRRKVFIWEGYDLFHPPILDFVGGCSG